jgi:hypothetical protein
MPNWLAPTVADIENALQAPEVAALREAVLGDSQADPVGTAIASVVPRVRGFIASRSGNRLDQDQTLVPPELFQDTVWLVIQALKARLGYGTPFTDDQKTLLRRAEDDLKKVATGDLRVSPPQNPETISLIQAGSDAEIVAGRTRLFGDQYGIAGAAESNTLAGAGITDGVSTNGHYIDPPWLVSFPWQWLSGKPTTVVGSGITDAVSTSALAAAVAALLASPAFTGTPTAPTAAANIASTQIATTAFVATAVDNVRNTAIAALDTLGEIAAALGNDPSFSTTVTNALALKAPLSSPALTGVPTAPTAAAGTSTTQIATTAFVGTAVANLVNSSPAALDTLAELAAALGNDSNFATTVTNSLALKAPIASPTFTGTVTIPNGAVIGNHAPSADGGASIGTSISAGRYASLFAKTAVKVTGPASGIEVWNTDAAVSTTVYEKAVFDFLQTANVLTIGTAAGGGATVRPVRISGANSGNTAIYFNANGDKWILSASGAFYPAADNSYDIGLGLGQSSARRIYAYESVIVQGGAGKLEIWNTAAAASQTNYEKFSIDWLTTANAVTIGTKFGGAGTFQRNIFYDAALHRFDIAGSPVAYVQSSGLTPTADGSKSLGQQTTYRWNYVYAKTGMQITGGGGQLLIYNLDPGTSGGSNEYGSLDWSSNAGVFTLGTYQSGGGLARTLRLQSASVLQIYATQGSSINAPSGTPPIDIRVNNVVKWSTNGNGDLIGTSGIKLFFGASTTSNASLNIPAGTAPTTPTDGDVWQDGTNVKIRIGGVTRTFNIS